MKVKVRNIRKTLEQDWTSCEVYLNVKIESIY